MGDRTTIEWAKATWNPIVTDGQWNGTFRVERVQAITREDIVAEGWDPAWRKDDFNDLARPVLWYSYMWDRINAKRGYRWDTNPFVWALTFHRVGAGG